MRKNIFKNTFQIFFAVCLFCFGFLLASEQNSSNVTSAQSSQNEVVDNSSVPNFLVKTEKLGSTEIQNGLVKDYDTFVYYSEGADTTSLTLSFARNGEQANPDSFEIYHNVFYPDPNNLSNFQFYYFPSGSVELSINGQSEKVGTDTISGTSHFQNLPDVTVEQFELVFNDSGTNGDKNNAVKITDESGALREGLYEIKFDMMLITCTDGGSQMSEQNFVQTTTNFTYSFIVTSRDSYMNALNSPKITNAKFDQVAQPATIANPVGYFLQSNHVSEGNANSIPYIEYDKTRFELSVSKRLDNVVTTESFKLNVDKNDMEQSPLIVSGDQIVNHTIKENTVRIYFCDVGTYSISLNAIQLVTLNDNLAKFELTGISNLVRSVEVDIFGYELGYTNYDQPADENHNRPVGVMRTAKFTDDEGREIDGVFTKNADKTSEYFNSESYTGEFATAFTRYNVVTFLNTLGEDDLVVTNQTPIKISTNATLAGGEYQSLILSTNNIGTQERSIQLKDETLYYTNFTGQTLTQDGTYIYIIFYTYDGYRTTTGGLNASEIFCQIFYFEIDRGNPDVKVLTKPDDGDKDPAKSVNSGDFTNKSVEVTDLTKNHPYKKNVDVRIYAFDYTTNSYMSDFGGTTGKSMTELADGKNTLTLTENARYTIRLYHTSDVKSINDYQIDESNTNPNGFISERTFTIDKTPISNIMGKSVSQNLATSAYTISGNMPDFVTNEAMTISWDTKDSQAQMWGYYRYFGLDNTTYYNSDNPSQILTNLITQHKTVAVNFALDMSTNTKNGWAEISGNAKDFEIGSTISSRYVLSNAGLYLVDIYDQAGNHAVKVFLIDNTTPLFVLDEGNTHDTYAFPSSTQRISTSSTLYWGDYKGIYIKNLTSASLFTSSGASQGSVSESDLKDDSLFKDHNGNLSLDIFDAIYEQLYKANHMQFFTIQSSISAPDSIDGYESMYLTLKINDKVLERKDENSDLEFQTYESHSKEITVDTNTNEFIYTIYIRDISNTRTVNSGLSEPSLSQDESIEQLNYTSFYSARQIVRVSFDMSQFKITYDEVEELPVGSSSSDKEQEIAHEHFAPTSMNKIFTLSFIPTVSDGDDTIQVDTVKMDYYPYVTKSVEDNGVTYYYTAFDDTISESTEIFNRDRNKETTEFSQPINAPEGITAAGKYVITRTYATGDGFVVNERDFKTRVFELIVDRNQVISSAQSNDDGHSESLVGGDIFVSMFDDSTSSNLVVTFPDSDSSHKDNQTLYNNWASMSDVQTVLFTNKVPVNVYVPKYKYTQHVSKEVDENGAYHFAVDYTPFSKQSGSKMNAYGGSAEIDEYVLFAQIFKKNQVTNAFDLLATTSPNANSGTTFTLDDENTENGFLKFFETGTTERLKPITESGEYYVTIYQGYFALEGAQSENSFRQSITFKFEITSVAPEFDVRGTDGQVLNSQSVTGESYSEIYHTNNSTPLISWNAAADKYNVEVEQIKIVAYNPITTRSQTYTCTKSVDGWITTDENKTEIDVIWAEKPNKQGSTYWARLNLKALSGVYVNGGHVDITMSFNSPQYATTTKRVEIDLSAPNKTISTLLSNSLSGRIAQMNERVLRMYFTQDNEAATDLNETCYNVSANSGDFAYYSYSVTTDFVDTLRSNKEFQTYVRKFVNANGENTKYDGDFETAYDAFSSADNRFVELANFATFDVGYYYEIVETDMAGNLTIFTIYIAYNPQYDPAADSDREAAENYLATPIISYETGEYTVADFERVKSAQNGSHAGAKHNIYSPIGFSLNRVNFFGDAWAQIQYTSANGISTTLMLTPFHPDRALRFVGNNSELVSLSSIINGSVGSTRKSLLSIFDRVNGRAEDFHITINNAKLVSNTTDNQELEYIRFNNVTDAQIENTTTAATFLTAMTISSSSTTYYQLLNPLGYVSDWTNTSYVTVSQQGGYLLFSINPALNLEPNTRIFYEFVDNYGTTYREIHLYREAIISQEITSKSDLYTYLDPASNMIYYITQNNFQYTYNPEKFEPTLEDNSGREVEIQNSWISTNADNTRTLTVPAKANAQSETQSETYFEKYTLTLKARNAGENASQFDKVVNFALYDQLAKHNDTTQTNKPGQYRILDASNKDITENLQGDSTGTNYFTEVRVTYSLDADAMIPTKFMVSQDQVTWRELVSGERLRCQGLEMETWYLKIWYDEAYLANMDNTATYVFERVPQSAIFKFNLSSLRTYYWVEVEREDGIVEQVERDSRPFVTPNGTQYTNHYMVAVDYNTNRNAVKIRMNNEQDMNEPEQVDVIRQGSVVSEVWKLSSKTESVDIPNFETTIVITYLPPSSNIVQHFYSTDASGTINNTDLVGMTNRTITISELYPNVDRIQIWWTQYYGITQNTINISLVKDGIELEPTVFTSTYGNQQYNYTYLTMSGKYSISFHDSSSPRNVHKFNNGQSGQSEVFTFTFLKDVPFTVTHTDFESGEQVTTLPIKQAVYNGAVTLNIDPSTRAELYTTSGYPVIHVTRNGAEYNGEFATNSTTFEFTNTGYYEVYFTATSMNNEQLRTETYQFTILNPDEHKISYVFNRYSNYYVEKVVKNGVDVTDSLVQLLDLETITVGTKQYLTQLPISYLDEKTGEGEYVITINTNNQMYRGENFVRSYTFKLSINRGTAPIRISISEGKSTTKRIRATFNRANIFEEMGECTLRVVKYTQNGTYITIEQAINVNAESTGEATLTVTEKGTHYIQIVSPSGNLLFSYKVVKKEPMNAATIIIIVVAAVLLAAIIFIIIKLRKRISVK